MPALSLLIFSSIVWAATARARTFSALSLNVAGLPDIFNDNDVEGDKTENTMLMGRYISQYNYDIVHVQEDFNYHATLYEYDDHPYRSATSGGVPFGSGLNTLSNYPWVDDVRVTWDECSNASGADCLTPKGFTFMRWRAAEGVYIDVYNLHTDAGTQLADQDARTANMRQVADYIDVHSLGNAVIVMGDTNSRHTRALDNIPEFLSRTGTTDAWVLHARNGNAPAPGSSALVCPSKEVPSNIACETVDKVFYRGSKSLTLTSTGFHYDTQRFLSPQHTTLTDHHPVRVDFVWEQADMFRTSDLFGGPHGSWFNDLPWLPSNPRVAFVTLRGGSRLDSISFSLTNGQTFYHGGTGGDEASLILDNAGSERIVEGTLCWGKKSGRTRNFYASLATNKGRTVSAGSRTSDCGTARLGEEWGIVGIQGLSGDEMDQVAWVFAKH